MVGEVMVVLVSTVPAGKLPSVVITIVISSVRLKKPCCSEPAVHSANVTGVKIGMCGESSGTSTIHSAESPCETVILVGSLLESKRG